MSDLLKGLFAALCPPAQDQPAEGRTGTRDGAGEGASPMPIGMQHIMALAMGQAKLPDPSNTREEYRSRVAQIIPAEVRMFSGCRDEQTSADVGNVGTFELPANAGPGGAGGACTNSMIEALGRNPNTTWKDLLADMRVILQTKRFTQVPQLSASKEMSLSSAFSIKKNSQSRTKALFIGINYVGHNPGQLSGCHNDVETMRRFVVKQGFDENDANMKYLMDDGKHTLPNKNEIINAFRWLVEGAKDGDSLFLHYSGHGGQMRDDDGDEADGMDETLVPLDYKSAGQICDDDILKEVVMPLPQGVLLTVIMDCCHSGSIMDLPYEFTASESNMQGGTPIALKPNSNFNAQKLMAVAMSLYEMHKKGANMSQLLSKGGQMLMQQV